MSVGAKIEDPISADLGVRERKRTFTGVDQLVEAVGLRKDKTQNADIIIVVDRRRDKNKTQAETQPETKKNKLY